MGGPSRPGSLASKYTAKPKIWQVEGRERKVQDHLETALDGEKPKRQKCRCRSVPPIDFHREQGYYFLIAPT